MKEKEAIEILEQIYDNGEIPLNSDPAFKLAIKALKKQAPKKPVHAGCYDKDDLCPNCNINLCTDGCFGKNKKALKYCPSCGQALLW